VSRMHDPSVDLKIVPVSFREACAFIKKLHRHHAPPRGMKFAIGILNQSNGELCGVATVGRPVARAYDPRSVCEVNRSCTDGTPNANSMLYGAARRVAQAMGYEKIITYTEEGESGASMRGAGFRLDKELEPRGSWAESSVKLKKIRNPVGTGGKARVRWVWP
jgi:hypothetical protein